MGNNNNKKNHSFDQPMMGFLTPKNAEDAGAMRKHFVAMSGEFVGTFMFLFFAFLGHTMAVQQAGDTGPDRTNSASTVIYISLSYGFSLLVTAWTLYRISGGLFNPAVTLGMIVTGTLPLVRGLLLIPAQILGGMAAAGVASAIIPGPIATTKTTLAPGVGVAQGVFLEMFLTAELVFTVLMLAAEKSKDTFIAPIGIGLALFVAEIAGVYYTGASLNPARSFGPCVAARSFESYHWIYWVGPALGALVAAGYFHFVKFFHYEDANPGQDSAGSEEPIDAGEAEKGPRSEQGAGNGAGPSDGGARRRQSPRYSGETAAGAEARQQSQGQPFVDGQGNRKIQRDDGYGGYQQENRL